MNLEPTTGAFGVPIMTAASFHTGFRVFQPHGKSVGMPEPMFVQQAVEPGEQSQKARKQYITELQKNPRA